MNQLGKQLVIVGAQMNLLVGDIEGNTERMIATATQAISEHQADLIVFPELSITSYPPEDLLFRPTLYRRVHEALQILCKTRLDAAIIVGYPDCIEGKYYNMVAVIQNGEIITRYAKQALPNYTVFDEKRYFSAGHEPCIFDLKGARLGIIICEDTWDGKPVTQSKEAGADILISINASPFALDKAHSRRNMLAQRSKEAGLPIVYVNLIGGQDELVFDGGSMVYDANGHLAQQALYYQEDLMKVAFDINDQAQRKFEIKTRSTPKTEPMDEEKLYNVLVLAVRDYVQKNNFSGVTLGLSGGIDSALTLAIACDAIGSEQVEAVMMPSLHTGCISLEDAHATASALGCRYSIIEIDAICKAFTLALEPEFSQDPHDITAQNLQARCRGTLLMAISNQNKTLVLTTSNKSEMAVGYATLYGDMAGGFSVLKDVYKTMVYRLCRYRNTLQPIIPERTLKRAPTAELAPGQCDQDTLPPYEVLDKILHHFITLEEDAFTIAKMGFDLEVVKRMVRLINSSEYKRRQAAPGIRLTEKAFGKDRRYPITSGYFKKYYA